MMKLELYNDPSAGWFALVWNNQTHVAMSLYISTTATWALETTESAGLRSRRPGFWCCWFCWGSRGARELPPVPKGSHCEAGKPHHVISRALSTPESP